MANRISTAELIDRLPDILDRIHTGGERFVVERDGQALATIGPVGDGHDVTWTEFVERLAGIPRPDDQFADDLEAIHAEMNVPVEPPEWPS